MSRANQFNILMAGQRCQSSFKFFSVVEDDIAITHLTYGKDFARAIEDKQVAQQDAERQKFIVEKAPLKPLEGFGDGFQCSHRG